VFNFWLSCSGYCGLAYLQQVLWSGLPAAGIVVWLTCSRYYGLAYLQQI
jgi:hypothetical protein